MTTAETLLGHEVDSNKVPDALERRAQSILLTTSGVEVKIDEFIRKVLENIDTPDPNPDNIRLNPDDILGVSDLLGTADLKLALIEELQHRGSLPAELRDYLRELDQLDVTDVCARDHVDGPSTENRTMTVAFSVTRDGTLVSQHAFIINDGHSSTLPDWTTKLLGMQARYEHGVGNESLLEGMSFNSMRERDAEYNAHVGHYRLGAWASQNALVSVK